jgi:Protein of unknown function (DUF3159)
MTAGPADGHDAPADAPVEGPAVSVVDAEEPIEALATAARSTLLADAIGGPRGLLDSGLPAIIFVIVNATSGLTPAIIAALALGVLLVAIRLARREPIQQAISGFFGLGIAAFVASRTHSAEGFFLPGILYQAALALAAVISLAVRRPYIGYVMAALDPRYAHWRHEPALLRAMDLATVIWGLVFLLRAIVQGLLYLAHHPGWLAFVKIVMGWPLFAAALAVSYALARRALPAARGEIVPASDQPTS